MNEFIKRRSTIEVLSKKSSLVTPLRAIKFKEAVRQKTSLNEKPHIWAGKSSQEKQFQYHMPRCDVKSSWFTPIRVSRIQRSSSRRNLFKREITYMASKSSQEKVSDHMQRCNLNKNNSLKAVSESWLRKIKMVTENDRNLTCSK